MPGRVVRHVMGRLVVEYEGRAEQDYWEREHKVVDLVSDESTLFPGWVGF